MPEIEDVVDDSSSSEVVDSTKKVADQTAGETAAAANAAAAETDDFGTVAVAANPGGDGVNTLADDEATKDGLDDEVGLVEVEDDMEHLNTDEVLLRQMLQQMHSQGSGEDLQFIAPEFTQGGKGHPMFRGFGGGINEEEDEEDENDEEEETATAVAPSKPGFGSWLMKKGYDYSSWAIQKASRVGWLVASSTIILFLPLMLASENERQMMMMEQQMQTQQEGGAAPGASAPMSLPPASASS